MPKRSYLTSSKAANGGGDYTTSDVTAGVDGNNNNKTRTLVTLLLLIILPIPFLVGIVFGGTEFFLQEVKIKGMSTVRSTSAFYQGATSHITTTSNHSHHQHESTADASVASPHNRTVNVITAAPPRPVTTSTTTEHAVWKDGPNVALISGANKFVQQRYDAYKAEEQGKHWKMRGHGWLHYYQNIVLGARANKNGQLVVGRNVVEIFNVHPQAPTNFNDCHLLTIWVRANGLEIFAGKAEAVPISTTNPQCYWKYEFDIAVPGSYTVDTKMLQWNGQAPVQWYDSNIHVSGQLNNEPCQCKLVYNSNTLPHEQFQQAPQKTSLMQFKPYTPIMGCCEMCRRLPGCVYWATPPKMLPKPQFFQNGCEFYFSSDVVEDDLPTTRVMEKVSRQQYARMEQQKREEAAKAATEAAAAGQQRRRRHLQELPQAWGSPYSDNAQVAHFLGCGWSFEFTLEFPCLSGDLDDWIYIEQPTMDVVVGAAASVPAQPQLPLCTKQDESLTPPAANSNNAVNVGRWVREPYPTAEQCPQPYDIHPDFPLSHPMSRHDGDHPHCWHRADLTPLNKQCLEPNCNLIEPRHRWNTTTIQHETHFNAVWRNYHCDYEEFTNAQLSQCFQQQQIGGIHVDGASISVMLTQYVNIRLENITMAPNGGKTVWVTTNKWPHLLWRKSADKWAEELKALPNRGGTGHAADEAYWISPFFITSEREPYVHLERALEFHKVAEPILKPKGYHMINVYDPSAAMTYDTAGQADGLHIIGPPMKIAVTKILHHLCSGVVQGTRL